jgi:hypothetical protein
MVCLRKIGVDTLHNGDTEDDDDDNSALKFIIPYLYEAQHVSGNTPPIIRSSKLH